MADQRPGHVVKPNVVEPSASVKHVLGVFTSGNMVIRLRVQGGWVSLLRPVK